MTVNEITAALRDTVEALGCIKLGNPGLVPRAPFLPAFRHGGWDDGSLGSPLIRRLGGGMGRGINRIGRGARPPAMIGPPDYDGYGGGQKSQPAPPGKWRRTAFGGPGRRTGWPPLMESSDIPGEKLRAWAPEMYETIYHPPKWDSDVLPLRGQLVPESGARGWNGRRPPVRGEFPPESGARGWGGRDYAAGGRKSQPAPPGKWRRTAFGGPGRRTGWPPLMEWEVPSRNSGGTVIPPADRYWPPVSYGGRGQSYEDALGSRGGPGMSPADRYRPPVSYGGRGQSGML